MGVQAMKHAALLQAWSGRIAECRSSGKTVLPERFAADPKASIDDLLPWNQKMRRTLLPNSSDADH